MPSASNTRGVIHPPQSLLRGKVLRSISSVSSPDCRSPQAQEDPAGPPPTIKTSHESIIRRLTYLGPDRRCCTAGRVSMERTGSGLPRTPPGTIAACPPGRQQWIRQDRAATCAQRSSLDRGRRCHTRSQICLASVRWFWRNADAGPRRRARRRTPAPEPPSTRGGGACRRREEFITIAPAAVETKARYGLDLFDGRWSALQLHLF